MKCNHHPSVDSTPSTHSTHFTHHLHPSFPSSCLSSLLVLAFSVIYPSRDPDVGTYPTTMKTEILPTDGEGEDEDDGDSHGDGFLDWTISHGMWETEAESKEAEPVGLSALQSLDSSASRFSLSLSLVSFSRCLLCSLFGRVVLTSQLKGSMS